MYIFKKNIWYVYILNIFIYDMIYDRYILKKFEYGEKVHFF